jgi:hypothetical protein
MLLAPLVMISVRCANYVYSKSCATVKVVGLGACFAVCVGHRHVL